MQNSCIIYILRILYIYIQYTYEHISGNFSKLKTQTLKEIDYIVNSVKLCTKSKNSRGQVINFRAFWGEFFGGISGSVQQQTPLKTRFFLFKKNTEDVLNLGPFLAPSLKNYL